MVLYRERAEHHSVTAEWNRFLQAAFKEHTDAEIECNALRCLFVTHVMESEWCRNEEEMEELARSMHHSCREQRQTYDRRKSSAKISKAVDNSATETATALGLSVGSNRAEGAAAAEDDDAYSPEVGGYSGSG